MEIEKALLITFLEQIAEDVNIAEEEIKPVLVEKAIRKETNIIGGKFDYIDCFQKLGKVKSNIDNVLTLIKND